MFLTITRATCVDILEDNIKHSRYFLFKQNKPYISEGISIQTEGESVKDVQQEACGEKSMIELKIQVERGYVEVTEQDSSSSGCFLLLGCRGFLKTNCGC